MPDVLSFILAGGQGERLAPLTRDRAKPAVPFAGGYRIIDFTLSNCINSGLRHIFLLTQYKSYALEKHVRLAWDVCSAELGEFISLLPPQQRMTNDWYRGTADAVYQNIYSIRELSPEYVLVLSGDHIYRMDYRRMLRFHRRHRADATIGLFEVPLGQARRFGVIQVDAAHRVAGFQEKPKKPRPAPGQPGTALVSMGVYLFTTRALVAALMVDAEDRRSSHDFGRDVLPAMLRGYRVFGFPFAEKGAPGQTYWRDVGTIDDYYQANMELVTKTPAFSLYDRRWPIRTRVRPDPPAKTVHASFEDGRVGLAIESLLCPGVVVSGGRVERSILGPRVRVNSYAEVQDSILFSDVEVGRGAVVRRAIVDKRIRIPAGCRIGVDPEQDRRRFPVTESGVAVLGKGTEL